MYKKLRVCLPFLFVLLFSGCGSSSGGGDNGTDDPDDSGLENSIENTPANLPDFDPVDLSLIPEDCRFELAVSSDMDEATLENTSAPCDYFVSGTQTVDNPLTIPAGTTFLLADGVSIRFRGTTVDMPGTASSPISFQNADAEEGSWGVLYFDDVVLDAEFLRADGGGNTDNQFANITNASVVINRGEVNLTNSTFLNSSTSGLTLSQSGFTTQINNFSSNRMSGNTDFGLVIGRSEVLAQLTPGSDFTGGDSPNGLAAIHLDFSRTEDFVFKDLGAAYFIEGLSAINTIITEGVEFWFAPGTGLSTTRSFYVYGTEDEPVLFSGTPDAPLTWAGIELTSTVTRMENFQVIGGGIGSSGGSLNLTASTADSIVRSGSIVDSQGWGVFCSSISVFIGNVVIEDLEINNSLAGDIHPECDSGLEAGVAPSGLALSDLPMDIANPLEDCSELLVTGELPGILRNGPSECDYHIRGRVSHSGNLIIEPGTGIVIGAGTMLSVGGGTLTANGTAADPITIQGEQAERGNWRGIEINASIGNQLNHVVIHGGGDFRFPALVSKNGDIEFQNSVIEGSDSYGLTLEGGTTLGEFSNNRFASNTRTGLTIDDRHIELLDNGSDYNAVEAPNGLPGIEISGTASDVDSDTFTNYGAPWYVDELFRVNTGFANTVTTVEADTHFLFGPNATFSVSTPIEFNGTVNEPITLSGVNESGPISNWGALHLTDQAALNHVQLTGGGAFPAGIGAAAPDPDNNGTILVRSINAEVILNSVSLNDSLGYGVTCEFTGGPSNLRPPTLTLNDTTFTNNTSGDLSPECEFVE